MNIAALLEKTADVLEKSAAYLEGIESHRAASARAVVVKKASDLAGKISDTVGDPVSEELIEELAKASPEVQELLGRLAGGGDNVESLGGPQEETKTASIDDVSSADTRFLDWVQS
jgi:uncharacterized phage infection (PIP) family protein YhgE